MIEIKIKSVKQAQLQLKLHRKRQNPHVADRKIQRRKRRVIQALHKYPIPVKPLVVEEKPRRSILSRKKPSEQKEEPTQPKKPKPKTTKETKSTTKSSKPKTPKTTEKPKSSMKK